VVRRFASAVVQRKRRVFSLVPPVLWLLLFLFGARLGVSRALAVLAGVPLGAWGLVLHRQRRCTVTRSLRWLSLLLNVALLATSIVFIGIGVIMLLALDRSHFH
jgi:hypothetical protein